MKDRLQGKAAVITGGGRGIGRALALGLASEGADIAVLDMDGAGAMAAAAEAGDMGRIAIGLKTDVTDPTQIPSAFKEAVHRLGKVDILVNNAGIARYAPFLEYSYEDWKKSLDTNLGSYFLCAQQAARNMVERKRGKIVNISSIVAQVAMPGSVAYAATKGGILSFTRVLALELAPYGICVNAIGPGPILTDMAQKTLGEEDRRAREAMIPMGRYGVTADLIGAAVFLSSSESDYITGQALFVDGGYLASGVSKKF